MRVARVIQPALIIESNRLRHERVALPPPDGISVPALAGFWRKPAAVGENLAEVIELLIEDHDDPGRLDDFERRIAHQHAVRYAMRYASFRGSAFAQGSRAFLIERCRPGLERRLTQIRCDILKIPPASRPPDPGQIQLAISRFWRRCRQVGLAVSRAGRVWQREVHPLR